jgi:mannose-6-phosphate isomerase-like protein (cupin superfamily)
MMTMKTDEVHSIPEQDRGEWLQVTPGERFKIRVPSAQTMGAYSVIEVVADPGNGVPLHIHNKEEEHFIVLEGTLDIANGDRRWDAPAGASVTVKRGVPHAWCNPSDPPLRMLVIFSPGRSMDYSGRWRVSTALTRSQRSPPATARSSLGRLSRGRCIRSTRRRIANSRRANQARVGMAT